MELFDDKENDYLGWIVANSTGYVMNCYKGMGRTCGPWMLHRADCYTLDKKNLTTGRYYKVCSTRKEELTEWAKREQVQPGYESDFQLCTKCNP